MASTCRFFDEDAVFRVNKKGQIEFGLILENAEFVSSDEEDEPDQVLPDWERMKRGHVRVAWHPKGQEEVLLEKKVRLFDRSLMPGDVVRRIVKGKDTQLGYCRNTAVQAVIQVVGSKKVITDVSSKDLTPLEEFSADIAVFLDTWVGMVKRVQSEVTLRCSDGSRCALLEDEAFDLDDMLDKRDTTSEFKKYSFYPGQQLWGPVHCFEKAKWFNSTKETQSILNKQSKAMRVTVEDVKVVSMGVQWLCRAYCEGSSAPSDVEQPKYLVQGDDLKRVRMMHIFEPCALQIGDRNSYMVKETDKLLTLDEWKQELSMRFCPERRLSSEVEMKPVQAHQTSEQEVTVEKNVVVVEELNGVEDDSEFEDIDDDWDEDGNTSDTASLTSLSTSSSLDKKCNKHKPKKGPSLATRMLKKKKLRWAHKKLLQDIPPVKPGDCVVTETLVTETMADVVWQDGTAESKIPSSVLYPIHHLDGHEFFPGDFVVENKDNLKPHVYGVVKRVDHTGRTALVTWMKTYMAGTDPHPQILREHEASVYDIKDHPDFKYRPGSCVIRVANFEEGDPASTAGQVLDVHPTGKVEVHWVSGKASLCYPQELYRIGEYDSDDLWDDDDSLADDNSWETESEGSMVGTEEASTTNLTASGKAEDKPGDETMASQDKGTSGLGNKQEEPDDFQALRDKMLSNIEKLRAGMTRLEEVFTQNPTLQTSAVMRKLLELYKHCKLLDQLLGTSYFHERHLQSLVDRLRHRGRVNSAQHVADQVLRLFSAVDLENGLIAIDPDRNLEREAKETIEKEIQEAAKDLNEAGTALIESTGKVVVKAQDSITSTGETTEPRNACRQLCSLLKVRLLKAHEDIEQMFGMSAERVSVAMAASEEASPKHEANEHGNIEETRPGPEVMEDLSEETRPEVEPDVAIVEKDKDERAKLEDSAIKGVFSVVESVSDSHKYKLSILQPTEPRVFFKMVRKEMQLLRTSLPEGIIIKGFEDRMDLYSVLIKGPKRTPYEDGIFLFDFQLAADYPKTPPLCHYISYCSDRLNPNLYEGGKVCVSLLGTWGGKGTEMWNPATSSILQVIVSIQGLILVAEPYYNEAGYERQRGTQQGKENSRMYNEMVVLKLVQSMAKLIVTPSEVFEEEIVEHFKQQAPKMIQRLEHWLSISEAWNADHPMSPTTPNSFKELHDFTWSESSASGAASEELTPPEFPLLPASKGFCLTLRKSLAAFKEVLSSVGILHS